MNLNPSRTLLVVTALAISAAANAHFLWLTKQGKRTIAQFAEAPNVSVIPKLAGRWNRAVLHVSALGASPLQLEKAEVFGVSKSEEAPTWLELDYGLLDKETEGRGKFLLTYYAKAATSSFSAWQPLGLPLEVLVDQSGETPLFKVLRNSKPIASAEIVVSLGERDVTIGKTDQAGQVRSATSIPSLTAVRAGIIIPATSTAPAHHFYTTLTLPAMASLGNASSHPEAYRLLERAHDGRYCFPNSVADISGVVRLLENGRELVQPFNFSVDAGLADEKLSKSLYQDLSSILSHRSFLAFHVAEGALRVRLGNFKNRNQIEVFVGEGAKTRYIIEKDRLVTVDRTVGNLRIVVQVSKFQLAPDGRTLPVNMGVEVRDAKSDQILNKSQIVDIYTEVDGVIIPAKRVTSSTINGKTVRKEIRLEQIKIRRRS